MRVEITRFVLLDKFDYIYTIGSESTCSAIPGDSIENL